MVREESVAGCGCASEALLSVQIIRDGGARSEVRLQGELDLYTAARVAAALRGLRDAGQGVVVVDIAGLGFIGARGLEVLAEAAQAYAAVQARLVVTGLSDRTRRLFRMTGLDRTLTME